MLDFTTSTFFNQNGNNLNDQQADLLLLSLQKTSKLIHEELGVALSDGMGKNMFSNPNQLFLNRTQYGRP